MKAVCGSDIGCIREENQDRVAIEYFDNAILGVLCDGMGGANCGSEASTLAINEFISTFKAGYREYFNSNTICDLLVKSMETANNTVYATSLSDDSKYGMGTTCVAVLLLNDGRVYIVNVGDSRAYLITNDDIKQITVDHNYSQYLYSIGKITAKELPSHPDRNALIRAVGVEDTIRVDSFELMPIDAFKVLICSDGLHGMISDDDIKTIVNDNTLEDVPNRLIEKAKACGGRDNVSVAILQP